MRKHTLPKEPALGEQLSVPNLLHSRCLDCAQQAWLCIDSSMWCWTSQLCWPSLSVTLPAHNEVQPRYQQASNALTSVGCAFDCTRNRPTQLHISMSTLGLIPLSLLHPALSRHAAELSCRQLTVEDGSSH